MLGAAKLAFKSYSALSSAVTTLKHPIKATQDAIRSALVSLVVKAVMAFAGERVVAELTRRVSLEKPVDFTLGVHKHLQGTLLDADTLKFVTTLANDALAAPLAVLGLNLGTFAVGPGLEAGTLRISGTFRLSDTAAPVIANPALPGKERPEAL